MKSKKIVWAFSGVGKSYAAKGLQNGKKVVDADCKLFQYKNVPQGTLHQTISKSRARDSTYPDNYINYIKELDADIVLVNCHPTLLQHFQDVLLVYPSVELQGEYLDRYKERGDNQSFIEYMQAEYKGMIAYLDTLDFSKVKIHQEKTYLTELMEGEGKFMFMTKREVAAGLYVGYCLKNNETYKEMKMNMLDEFFTKEESDMEKMAQQIFDGEIEFDFEKYKEVLAVTESQIQKEELASKRRLGLTHEELSDKIMQGIVNGALGIRYAEISPYSHGYEVTFGGEGPDGSTRDFTNRWECYCDLFEVSDTVAQFIEENRQHNEVFGKRCEALDLSQMLKAIDKKEVKKMQTYTPEAEANITRRSRYSMGHVASVMDVHAGKALDGIAKHYYHGDYSTITPVNQNNLVETLVYLKGFCLDYLNHLDNSRRGQQQVIDYLKNHGTDITTPEKLEKWIRNNPEKCCLEENRSRRKPLDLQMDDARQDIEAVPYDNEPSKEIEQDK